MLDVREVEECEICRRRRGWRVVWRVGVPGTRKKRVPGVLGALVLRGAQADGDCVGSLVLHLVLKHEPRSLAFLRAFG